MTSRNKILFPTILFGLLLPLLFLTKCNKPVDIDLNPKILTTTDPSGDYLTPQDTLKINFRLVALDGFQYFRIQETNTGVLFSLDQNSFGMGTVLDSSFTLNLSSYAPGTDLGLEFLLQDGKSRSSTKVLDFTMANPIDTGSWDFGPTTQNLLPSFFGADSLKAFTLVSASPNSAKIDLGFYLDSIVWNVASPSDSIFSQVFLPEISSWPVQNSSRMKKTSLTRQDWEDLRTDGPIWESLSNASISRIDNLKTNWVFSFITVDSIPGIALVESIQKANTTLPDLIQIRFKIGRE